MNPLIASSSNPEKLSLTITGALTAIVPVLIAVFQLLGIAISETFLFDIIQQIGVIVSAGVMLVGLLRKAYNIVRTVV